MYTTAMTTSDSQLLSHIGFEVVSAEQWFQFWALSLFHFCYYSAADDFRIGGL